MDSMNSASLDKKKEKNEAVPARKARSGEVEETETFFGVTTPLEQADIAATDSLSGIVEAITDKLAGNQEKQ